MMLVKQKVFHCLHNSYITYISYIFIFTSYEIVMHIFSYRIFPFTFDIYGFYLKNKNINLCNSNTLYIYVSAKNALFSYEQQRTYTCIYEFIIIIHFRTLGSILLSLLLLWQTNTKWQRHKTRKKGGYLMHVLSVAQKERGGRGRGEANFVHHLHWGARCNFMKKQRMRGSL